MGSFLDGIESAANEAYQGTAGAADALAGSTDEATGRATDAALSGDVFGVGDALAGSTDEATGQATNSLLSGDLAGVGDALAGDTDEAVGRATSADSATEAGDALLGGFDEAAGQAVSGGLQFDSALLGSVDESVERQFDDKEGGGFADEALGFSEDVAKDLTPDWMNWFVENPFLTGAGLVGLVLFVSAGGLDDVGGGTAA